MENPRGDFLPPEMVQKLADLTTRLNREIAVYLDRKGKVVDVSVGDNRTVSLPEIEGRRQRAHYKGIRCVHTHPNGDGRLSEVDISSLLNLGLDAMIALGVDEGRIPEVYAALPADDSAGSGDGAEVYGPFAPDDSRLQFLFDRIRERDREMRNTVYGNQKEAERAILVGLDLSSGKQEGDEADSRRLLDELEELAQTAGALVVEKVLQKRDRKDPGYMIGRGKVEQLALMRQALDADLIIFDDELSGAQLRNIEETIGARVIDRAALILDIFAQRAKSREGKLQVELAQLKYRLPRLMGMGVQLSRLGGGIGTRGPGEKKLEVDKRHIRRRIKYLEDELAALEKRRALARTGRKKDSLPVVAVVGYTNVGKSTLINTLCHSDVFVENKLFATLDPSIRKCILPDGREALLVDTVGFIRKLPHDLVEAFKSTLEEAVYADALLHVVDISSDEVDMQISVVHEILHGLGAADKPFFLVFNKVDAGKREYRLPLGISKQEVFEVSAVTGEGLDRLLEGMVRLVPADQEEVALLAPYREGWILPYVHAHGTVLEQEYRDNGIYIKALVKKSKMVKLNAYRN